MTAIHHTARPVNVRRNLYSPVPDNETEEQKFQRYWKTADEARYGKMPDTTTPEGRERWLAKIGSRLHGFFVKCGIVNLDGRRDLVKEAKDILVARNRYDEDFAFELAEICLQIRRDDMKGKTVLDTLKEREIMSVKQAHPHVATDEQKTSAKAAFSAPVESKVSDAETMYNASLDRIDREMGHKPSLTLRKTVWRDHYDGATIPAQVVAHPNFNQLAGEQIYTAAVAKVMAGQQPISQAEIDKSIADAAFPRCKTHNEPLNEAGKCAICELNASVVLDEKPAPTKKDPSDTLWFQFYHNCKETWGYEHDFILNEILRADSAKSTGMSPVQAMMKVKAYHDEQSKSPESTSDKPVETATPATPEKAPEPPKAEIGIPAPPVSEGPKIAPSVANPNGVEKLAPKYAAPLVIQTLNGVPMQMIRQELDKPLPPQAYSAIKGGSMKGKTDIDVERIRDRFDQVFGSQGLGWAIEPIPNDSHISTTAEIRQAKDKDGKLYEQTWFVIDLINYRLRYTVVLPDGTLKDCFGTAMCESGDNMDRGYALEGTMSSLMKQAYRRMGGMNHVYYGVYTHIQAQRDLGAA